MYRLPLLCLLASTPALLAQDAPAWTNPRPVRFAASLGFTFGGDELGSLSYSDGSSNSVRAGSGVLLKGGVDYHPLRAFSFQGTLGMHRHDTKAAKGGSMMFNRTVLEGMAYYHFQEHIRGGIGIRKVSAPTLSGSGVASDYRAELQDTQGTVLELEWLSRNLQGPRFGFSIRYGQESFNTNGAGKVDANHFGIAVSGYF